LVEQRTENPCVPGSIPGGTTRKIEEVETFFQSFSFLGAYIFFDLRFEVLNSIFSAKCFTCASHEKNELLPMISFKIFLRNDHQNSDGTKSVYIRLINKRKKKDISLRIFVHSCNWNTPMNRVKNSDVEYVRKNKLITKYENRARNIIDEHFLYDKPLSFNIFSQKFFTEDHENESFYDYALNKLENRKLSKETYKAYKSQIAKLKAFRKVLYFTDVNAFFIHQYKKYLLDDVGNNENTVSKCLRSIKTFINWAIEDELMKNNPFQSIRTKKIDGKREFLSIMELEKLEQIFNEGGLKNNLHNVLRYFLFACYTGLRYTDMKELCFKHIIKTSFKHTEFEMIDINMHKTKLQVTVPLIKKAKDLLHKKYNVNQKVFNVLTNQKTNQNLKVIMKYAGISKNITFHSARHTFATNGLEMGIPIEIVSKILGHTELKTTQIYAKVNDGLKFKEMQKLNEIGNAAN